MSDTPLFLTAAQLKAELAKCEYCAEKPCRQACPAHCSPADFIMAARVGELSDLRRAAAEIMTYNPLGGICGLICPHRHCQQACVRQGFDHPVNIPAVQATIVARAKEAGVMPQLTPPAAGNTRIAVVGAGPAGLAAATLLGQQGFQVAVYEKNAQAGGACRLIPEHRLPPAVIDSDLQFCLPCFQLKCHSHIADPRQLLTQGYAAVVMAIGRPEALHLNIAGEEQALMWDTYLAAPERYPCNGKVAVIGGGAVAVDCAVSAARRGASGVELFSLEKFSEMPLTPRERAELLEYGIELNGRVRVNAILTQQGNITGLHTQKVSLPAGQNFHPTAVQDVPGTEQQRQDIDQVIIAIGSRASLDYQDTPGIFYCGDCLNGPTTVVEAVAAGKNTASTIQAWLAQQSEPVFDKVTKSYILIPGYQRQPVSLASEFYGRPLLSPFLLSAAPPSDGYEQMKKAYQAGWAGGVMKTAFDNVPIHIPACYMNAFDANTWGNCDNVSGHPLERVCREVAQLVQEFPDRLTMASTGGPVTGNDAQDKQVWQSNTRKLEAAGAMGIEYSLSCPQGGDGTEGDIVSQNAALTAKIIDWVLEASNPEIPKLFKLTAAVTSIVPIVNAIKEVFARYPQQKAGITLANTFPTLCFKKGSKPQWEEGVVVGMSGAGVTPISNLTLANVAPLGVTISGNGGPMDYKAAAHFLALGVKTVQFCTIVMKYGYDIIHELHSGLSHLLAQRGIGSVSELIGIALPNPITDFMDLSAVKPICTCEEELCISCGNCTRCSYQAISLNDQKHPVIDAAKCIGCSICTTKCLPGALSMRARTPEEAAALQEA